jgi:hypothetical protein
MSVKIGKLLPDGRVRYIDLFTGGISSATCFTLKNFYLAEKRVDALLDLGNLNHIGPSPYGRSLYRYDFAHCYSEIRDKKASKKENEAVVSESKEMFSKLTELSYLYENGKWTILIGERSESIEFSQVIELIKWNPFFYTEFYEFQKENQFSQFHPPVSTWKELKVYAERENKTLYAFRHNRLATVINHPLTKKKIA